MPKGSKGWPIVVNRFTVGRLSIGRGGTLAAIALLIMLAVAVWDPDHSGARIFVLLLIGMGMSLGTVALMLIGRTRFTPTTALWVPHFGRPRWVALADAKAVMQRSDGYVFDIGHQIKIPCAAIASARNQTTKSATPADPDENPHATIGRFIDDHFKAAGFGEIRDMLFASASLVGSVILCGIWMTVVFRWPVQAILSTQFPQHMEHLGAGRYAVVGFIYLFAGLLAPACCCWFAVSGLSRLLGLANPLQPRWRYRRDDWQGFEIELRDGAGPGNLVRVDEISGSE